MYKDTKKGGFTTYRKNAYLCSNIKLITDVS